MGILSAHRWMWNAADARLLMLSLTFVLVTAEVYEDAGTVTYLPEYAELRHQIPTHFRRKVEILCWTTAYGTLSHWAWWFSQHNIAEMCPEVADRCLFTTDKQRLNVSDAVAFMTYGSSMRLQEDMTDQLPPHRMPNQRWIHVSLESPPLSESNEDLTKLAGVFNWTMDYRRDADVFAPFGRIVLKKQPLAQRQVALYRDYAEDKTKLVAWYVSHCSTDGRREKFVEELQRHIPVDVWGECGPLKCEPPRSDKCYRQLADYKFYLSFENILCDDYISEKFFNVLGFDIVPVVFGGANYSAFAPPGSFVDALDYGSPKDLADFLLKLGNDTKRYNRYFDWKRGYSVTILKDPFYVCEMCVKLMDPDQPPKSYDNIHDWWHRGGKCRVWNP